jgi:hypothetical protein
MHLTLLLLKLVLVLKLVLATLVLAKSGFSRERYPSNTTLSIKHNAIHQTMPMVAGS